MDCPSSPHAFTRARELERFRTDPQCLVLLLGKKGAHGLDLSFVTHMFLMDQIWDRSLETQVWIDVDVHSSRLLKIWTKALTLLGTSKPQVSPSSRLSAVCCVFVPRRRLPASSDTSHLVFLLQIVVGTVRPFFSRFFLFSFVSREFDTNICRGKVQTDASMQSPGCATRLMCFLTPAACLPSCICPRRWWLVRIGWAQRGPFPWSSSS